ncbi:hypothetical protein [Kribbella solani]|uniref:hypothetical protein n=1 Tax=Kribbella solani TaxID=236067 RepID=UPI0029A3C09E|nr:hypothetical protein [Kribbella solani]MDX2969715.1 hypothetical protein [Kribbella solani]
MSLLGGAIEGALISSAHGGCRARAQVVRQSVAEEVAMSTIPTPQGPVPPITPMGDPDDPDRAVPGRPGQNDPDDPDLNPYPDPDEDPDEQLPRRT